MGEISHELSSLCPIRPFHVEPKNIVEDSAQERVSSEASVLNSRLHYYSRLTASSDKLLVLCMTLLTAKPVTPVSYIFPNQSMPQYFASMWLLGV